MTCWWRRLSHCCVKANTGNDLADLILKNTVKHTVTIAMLPYISPPRPGLEATHRVGLIPQATTRAESGLHQLIHGVGFRKRTRTARGRPGDGHLSMHGGRFRAHSWG